MFRKFSGLTGHRGRIVAWKSGWGHAVDYTECQSEVFLFLIE